MTISATGAHDGIVSSDSTYAAEMQPDDENISTLSTASFAGALPKEEIGALRFLQENPDYDGRGVIIAIFDTGVDPGAAGLETTPDGRPKILDVIDCTGSSDIDTSKVVQADDTGSIVGASGRTLKLSPEWANPSGDWRIGLKRLYELLPRGLKANVEKERKKEWDKLQRATLAAATAELAKFDRDVSTSDLKGDPDLRKQRLELEARLERLKGKPEDDPGPFIDCVVWHDGTHWRSAIHSSDLFPSGSGKGALADSTPLASFKFERQYGKLGGYYHCNYAANVYEEGDVLSLVIDAGAHGTHVAGIAAAYFPEDPDLNGVAPGAQIISCKIGDSRLGSMETLTGLSRALTAVVQHKVDVINMSYGEPSQLPNMGRFVQLAHEVVHKHGVVFVASAGNSGPALSTVGAPGGTSSGLIGIGAYVSPALAAAGHSARGTLAAGVQYTWSSRGPTGDGDIGVAFSAPGGAIAPVPQWTRQKRQLMNGTSMAAPNATGAIALLLSSVKGQGRSISPAALRAAVEATCLPLGDAGSDGVLTYGRGLIQVDKAFTYLQKLAEESSPSEPDVRYEVLVNWGGSDVRRNQRGIYMREPADSAKTRSFTCSITPLLHEDAEVSSMLEVDQKLVLESTADWVTCPPMLLLHHAPRAFELQVSPTLPPGVHYAEVRMYDAEARWKGPVAVVPITVIRPIQIAPLDQHVNKSAWPSVSLGSLPLREGSEHRFFVAVPEGATWAELILKASGYPTSKTLMIRTTQLLPNHSYREGELRDTLLLPGSAEYTTCVSVAGGATMEVTVGQLWSSFVEGDVQVDLEFHGVWMNGGGGLAVLPGEGAKKMVLHSPLRRERVSLSPRLTSLTSPLRPTEAQLQTLADPRDFLPDDRPTYRLTLTYKLTVTEPGKFEIRNPLLNKYMYDNFVESHFTMVLDANKQLIGCSDTYAEEFDLKKGDYTIRVAMRHDNVDVLEKLRGTCILASRKLDSTVYLPVYRTLEDAVTGGAGAKEFALEAGEWATVYAGQVADDKLPKDAKEGSTLEGTLAIGQRKKLSGSSPATYPVVYVIPPKSKVKSLTKRSGAASDEEEGGEGEEKGAQDKAMFKLLMDVLTDKGEGEGEVKKAAALKAIQDMSQKSEEEAAAAREALNTLCDMWPDHLPLFVEALKMEKKQAKSTKDEHQKKELLKKILVAAERIVDKVDAPQLLQYFALKCPLDLPDARTVKKQMSAQKTALVNALTAKLEALLDLEDAEQEVGAGGVEENGTGSPAPTTAAPATLGSSGSSALRTPPTSTASNTCTTWSFPITGAEPSTGPDSAASIPDLQTSVPAATSVAESKGEGQGEDEEVAGEGESGEGVESAPDVVKAAWLELRKWVDTAESAEHALLHARCELRAGRAARALKASEKAPTDSADNARAALELRSRVYSKLGWGHWQEREQRVKLQRFPSSFPLF